MFRTVSSAFAVIFAIVFSQGPEFAEQYQQRLGGAIGELEPIVRNFDADAQRSDLTRAEALAIYGRSHEQFLQDRGQSMVEVFDRYESLLRQRQMLREASSVMQPVLVLTSADAKLMTDTRRDFAPAVPVSLAGFVHAALGFMIVMIAALCIAGALRLRRRIRYSTDL